MNPKVFNLISGRNETRFMILVSVTVDLMKFMQFHTKKWKYDECPCACKELDDWRFYERGYMWNLSTCDCDCNKACKIDEYLGPKSCLCKKRLISKLVLQFEDEMLNTAESYTDDKKVPKGKSNRLIHTISLVVIWLLLLAVISIVCYYYYIRYWIKNTYYHIHIK